MPVLQTSRRILAGLIRPRAIAPRLLLTAACAAAIGSVALLPAPAHAWWRGGVFIGVPPIVVGPPVYYPPVYAPPPVVYAPPPVIYTPAPQTPYRCYAGGYVCPLRYAAPAGAACTCVGNGGEPVPGRVGG